MAKPSSLNIDHSLQDFIKIFDLPKRVLVTEGYAGNTDDTSIDTGQVLTLLRLKSIPCLSGVTVEGKHEVGIPVNCLQKVEIPYPSESYEPVETVEELVSFLPRLKYVRVIHSDTLHNKDVIKAGEILEILHADCKEGTLVTLNSEGYEVPLPMSCSAGFRLLDCRVEFLLSDLVSKGLLPIDVRFVEKIPPDVRETFLEDNHHCSLGVVFLRKSFCEHAGVETTFGFDIGAKGPISWLSLNDIDISVSLLHSQCDSEIWDDTYVKPEPQTSHLKPDKDSREYEELSPVSDANPSGKRRERLAKCMSEGSLPPIIPRRPNTREVMRVHSVGAYDEQEAEEFKHSLNKTKAFCGKSHGTERNSKSTSRVLGAGEASKKSRKYREKAAEKESVFRYASRPLPPLSDDFKKCRSLPKHSSLGSLQPAVFDTNPDSHIHEVMVTSKSMSRQDVLPPHISQFTQDHVLLLLKNLKLETYSQKFAHEQVDGVLLVDLDQDLLMEHFGMTRFHAVKLSSFVKGGRQRWSTT